MVVKELDRRTTVKLMATMTTKGVIDLYITDTCQVAVVLSHLIKLRDNKHWTRAVVVHLHNPAAVFCNHLGAVLLMGHGYHEFMVVGAALGRTRDRPVARVFIQLKGDWERTVFHLGLSSTAFLIMIGIVKPVAIVSGSGLFAQRAAKVHISWFLCIRLLGTDC